MPEEVGQGESRHFEAVVVGSGFGGAVTACRLAEAGFEVCILERGRRYESADFPAYPNEARAQHAEEGATYEPPRDMSRWLWPVDQGIWDVKDLGEVAAVMAAGYGGGSLVYASVHLRAPPEVFDEHWPPSYTRDKLDRYYDLVAYMLQVDTFPQAKLGLSKTHRLGQAGGDSWFLPPLAVNFGNRVDLFNVEQGVCDLRGYCCLGCGAGAKNSLDFNYLKLAEEPVREGGRAAEVITLAEVIEIARKGDGEKPKFELTYYDHLQCCKKSLTATYVFLAAGSVNSTALLFRSVSGLFDQDKQREASARLGARYFPNADSLVAVFDCDHAQEVDKGPTITSSIVYESDSDWFLIQDGGVPRELDAVLGVFRSPLWLRRNRYLEKDAESRAPQARGRIGPALLSEQAKSRTLTKFGGFQQKRARGAREVLALLPPHSAEQVRATQGLQYPTWLENAVADIREQALDNLAIAAEPIAQAILDDLATLLEPRMLELAETMGSEQMKNRLKLGMNQGLSRGLVRLGAQLLWGSESDAVRHALRLLLQLPNGLDETTQRAISFLKWCADFRSGDGRTGLLLTMGRDPAPGTLTYTGHPDDWESAGLSADLDERRQRTLRSAQERAFRDIAEQWGGELRTNPAWTFAGRRVTVHSQGGCPTGVPPDQEAAARAGDSTDSLDNQAGEAPEPVHPVSQESGELYDCPGLYVMDASAFPTAVGVNPAPTIAAIAEYKVERFIRERRKDPKWRAHLSQEAEAWCDERREMLDPIARTPPKSEIKAKPIGIRFCENMTGNFSRAEAQDYAAGPSSSSISGGFPMSVLSMSKDIASGAMRSRADLMNWVRRLEAAEIRGIRNAGGSQALPKGALPDAGEIKLECNAEISDLATFLDDHRAGQTRLSNPKLELTGKVIVDGETCEIIKGSLDLFHSKDSVREKNLHYKIEFAYEDRKFTLDGLKTIRDDARFDVWTDTATMYFSVVDSSSPPSTWNGILRLPAAEFVQEQIKSFDITGTTDKERKVWALTAFVLFFFGHLAESYMPEAKLVPEVLRNMVTRTHG